MSAKATDLARIQEMFDLITETQGQIERLGITEERFKRPATDADRLFSEAIMNRVLRDVVQGDFPKLLEGCQAYCDDLGLELESARR